MCRLSERLWTLLDRHVGLSTMSSHGFFERCAAFGYRCDAPIPCVHYNIYVSFAPQPEREDAEREDALRFLFGPDSGCCLALSVDVSVDSSLSFCRLCLSLWSELGSVVGPSVLTSSRWVRADLLPATSSLSAGKLSDLLDPLFSKISVNG